MAEDVNDACERCGRPVQPGTVHHQTGDGSCVVATVEPIERSEGMSRVERRL